MAARLELHEAFEEEGMKVAPTAGRLLRERQGQTFGSAGAPTQGALAERTVRYSTVKATRIPSW